MVCFQSLPRVNKNLIKKNILSLDGIKNSKLVVDELVKNPSFSLVCLFLKFLREDYFTYGELASFKNFFEEKKGEYTNFLLKSQEVKEQIWHEKKGAILEKYNEAIQLLFSDLIINRKLQHNHDQENFSNYLDQDILDLKIQDDHSIFYILHDTKENLTHYAVFIYYQFQKLNVILYNPKVGLKSFHSNEMNDFKTTFDKMLKKVDNTYISYKIKIAKETAKPQANPLLELEEFSDILLTTSNKFNRFIAEKNLSYFSANIREEVTLSQAIVNIDCKHLSQKYLFNIFTLRLSEFIQKLKNNLGIIHEKSFWTIFLINFYSSNQTLKETTIGSLDPLLGKEKIYDFLVTFFNKKCEIPSYQSKKIICLIIINTYKQIIYYKYRIPYFSNITTLELPAKAIEFGRKLITEVPLNSLETTRTWNNINVIYNERYISKRFNGTFQPVIGISSIGKAEFSQIVKKLPTLQQLESHFVAATQCNDLLFSKFCLGLLNEAVFERLSPFFNTNNLGLQYKYDLAQSYILIQKICPQIYDFSFIFYIHEILSNNERKSLAHPILFSLMFPLTTKDDSVQIQNFYAGFLDTMHVNEYSEQFKQLILSKTFS